MSELIFCGVDIGTSNVKVILIDEAAKTVWSKSSRRWLPRPKRASWTAWLKAYASDENNGAHWRPILSAFSGIWPTFSGTLLYNKLYNYGIKPLFKNDKLDGLLDNLSAAIYKNEPFNQFDEIASVIDNIRIVGQFKSNELPLKELYPN